MLPEHFSPSKKRIIEEYISIMETEPAAGSSLYRKISQKLHYKIDNNNTNSFVSKVIKEYLTLCS